MLQDPTRHNTSIPRPLHQLSSQQQSSPTFYNHTIPTTTSAAFPPNHASIDLDFDDYHVRSFASSPISTQSVLSQYSGVQSSPLSTFDSIPTAVSPRGPASLFEFPSQRGQSILDESTTSLFANTDQMQTDSWIMNGGHLTPRTTGRSIHQRESSLSSLGSNGPSSPYSQNTSNPHIAVTDSMTDYHGMPNADDFQHYQLVKSYNRQPITHDTYYASFPNSYTSADASAIASYPRITVQPKQRTGGLLPPDQPIGSRPVSVASSITSDSPATPAEEPEDVRRRRNVLSNVPKLARTMTDAYHDELYSPNFTIASSNASQGPTSPNNSLFNARLQQAAANSHLSAVPSPISATSRDRSPFRNGSPLAPMPVNEFPSYTLAHAQNKAAQDARAQQQLRSVNTSTPQTISPKDAMLEFHDADESANFSLFPQSNTNGFNMEAMSKAVSQSQTPFDSMAMDTSFNSYLGPQLSTGLQIPQQYPFIAQRPQSSVPSLSDSLAPSRMGSAETGANLSQSNSPQRPTMTSADGGTYTCTYHGCTLRFETPQLLQKHKREGHRQAHGLGGSRRAESVGVGMTSTLLNSQAGPHRCDRINPSTGKPCNTIFSRPYDLTRHEDTIHNARKQKVRCDLCTDEKTFSRADALTRHYRVCHPDVEFPGKQRRRGGHSG